MSPLSLGWSSYCIQVNPHSSHPAFKPSRIQTIPHSNHPAFKPSRIQTIPHSNHPAFKPSRIQTIPHSSHPAFKPSRIQAIDFVLIAELNLFNMVCTRFSITIFLLAAGAIAPVAALPMPANGHGAAGSSHVPDPAHQ